MWTTFGSRGVLVVLALDLAETDLSIVGADEAELVVVDLAGSDLSIDLPEEAVLDFP